jgi:hypothetical protein
MDDGTPPTATSSSNDHNDKKQDHLSTSSMPPHQQHQQACYSSSTASAAAVSNTNPENFSDIFQKSERMELAFLEDLEPFPVLGDGSSSNNNLNLTLNDSNGDLTSLKSEMEDDSFGEAIDEIYGRRFSLGGAGSHSKGHSS